MGRVLWVSIALAGMVAPAAAQRSDTTRGRDTAFCFAQEIAASARFSNATG
jgi:hypothetical protein